MLQLHETRTSIYSVLATCELGVCYIRKSNGMEKAGYFFDQVEKMMSEINLDESPFWTLFLYDNLSKYYSSTKQDKQSLKILDIAISFAKQHHVPYFLDQYYFLYAAKTRNKYEKWNESAILYLLQAYTFAKFNGNDVVLNKAESYLKEIDDINVGELFRP